MAWDKVWSKKWNVYSQLSNYQIKQHVDTKSGLVIGFLVALESEPDPDENHVHYWYDAQTRDAGYQMKSGNTHFRSSFSDHVIQDIADTLPSLLVQ